MESTSTTSSNIFGSHPLPHQQYSSRIAFANNSTKKVKLNSLSTKKGSTRLPPIARSDSTPVVIESIQYFNENAVNTESIELNDKESSDGSEHNLRVKQLLEKKIKFVREDCQHILEALHYELDELKIKNRDLQFQLIMNGSLSPQLTQSLAKERVVLMPLIRGALEPQMEEQIKRLENEVKRLRYALGETLKMNSVLKTELEKYETDINDSTNESPINWLSSPTIGEFDKTFEQIYRKTDKNCNEIENEKTISLPRIANSCSN